MRKESHSQVRRSLLAGLVTMVMALMLTVPSFGKKLAPLSGGTEDATVQIGCGDAARLKANPLKLTVNYQKTDRDVAYDHNTSSCPIVDFNGERLAGREGSGNIEAVTIGGQRIARNAPARQVEAQGYIIIVRVYDYSGRLYIEVIVLA